MAGAPRETKILPARAVYEDLELEGYLTEIVRRVTPSRYTTAGGQPIGVKLRKDPRLNAAAMAANTLLLVLRPISTQRWLQRSQPSFDLRISHPDAS